MSTRLEAVEGDITLEHVDAVVNAANAHLAPGGGVCGAIFAAAGPGLREACEALGGAPTGEVRATAGFGLPARWILHAVGPVWQGGDRGEEALLASCYRRSVELAAELGARSLAFPAFSRGFSGYPGEPAAEVAVATVRSTVEDHPLDRVRFVCFDRRTLAAHRAALGQAPGARRW
ncbi:MAG: macro domain-containing protein [Acidimicrobiia bacterium]|nr:macro domain-containing protein [Acidimicrobiia bacterium]